MASSSSPSILDLEYRNRIAILTINNPTKLNALSPEQYYQLAQKMTEIATRDDIYITVLIGKGRYFSA